MKAQVQFDAELAVIYDETRPIDSEVCLSCFRDALQNICGNKDSRILDVGCGTGRILECLIPNLLQKEQVVGIDISPAMLAIAKAKPALQGVAFKNVSVTNFASESENHQCFDVIICHWLFHWMPDWQSVLRACTCLAKKSGILIWLNEDGDLYQALDGLVDPQTDSKKPIHILFDTYYQAVNGALSSGGSQTIVPSSRAGTVLRCTSALEKELAKWGWEVRLPWETRYWKKEVSVNWIIDKVLTPRVFTNLRGISPEANVKAIEELKKQLGCDGIPSGNDSVELEFRAKAVVACTSRSQNLKLPMRANRLQKLMQKLPFSKCLSNLWFKTRVAWFRREPAIRAYAEKRSAFIPLTIACLVVGICGIILKIRHETGPGHSWGEVLIEGAALLLAALGFFYAIYAIKGLIDRPRDLDEVLMRTARLIERFSKKECVAVMLCEYPAWGALSFQNAPAYREFKKALTGFIGPSANRKLVLVAPNPHEMSRRITLYQQDYVRSNRQTKDAISGNEAVIELLKGGGKLSENYYKHWEVDEVPRYQMLLIGEEIPTGEKDGSGEKLLELVPSEAIVWFAPRNSDIKDPSKRKVVDWTWSETDVPVLAWQTTDPYILNELYECARFYVHRDCKVPCDTYKEFLG